jgi:hypothetical protein
MIAIYVAVRFEWRTGSALSLPPVRRLRDRRHVSLIHPDSLTSVAALLTLAGYSVNDTVVVLIASKPAALQADDAEGTDQHLHQSTLSRTVLTSGATAIDHSLLLFGGPTLFDSRRRSFRHCRWHLFFHLRRGCVAALPSANCRAAESSAAECCRRLWDPLRLPLPAVLKTASRTGRRVEAT